MRGLKVCLLLIPAVVLPIAEALPRLRGLKVAGWASQLTTYFIAEALPRLRGLKGQIREERAEHNKGCRGIAPIEGTESARGKGQPRDERGRCRGIDPIEGTERQRCILVNTVTRRYRGIAPTERDKRKGWTKFLFSMLNGYYFSYTFFLFASL